MTDDTAQTAAMPGEDAQIRVYEVGYTIVPTIPEEEVPREVTALKDLLEKEGASVFAEEFPKLRQLAYGIEKRTASKYDEFTTAYFGWMKFDASTEAIKRIEKALKGMERLLRFIVIKTVREQTMSSPRAPRTDRAPRKEAPKDAPAGVPVSETELEKAMEKIIAE